MLIHKELTKSCLPIFYQKFPLKKVRLQQPALAWRATDGPLETIRLQTQLLPLAIIRG
jgi:hypothetical protein